MVEQFRPGVMDRLGLGYDAVQAINPALIYCSITGYGQAGPARGEAGARPQLHRPTRACWRSPGHATAPGGAAGADRRHRRRHYPAVINILLALRQRDRTGQGLPPRHRDGRRPVHFRLVRRWATAHAPGDLPGPGGELVTGGSPRYQLYPTRDGKFVAAAPLEQKFWDAFTAAIGLGPAAARRRRRSGGDPRRRGGHHRRPHRGGMGPAAGAAPIAAAPSSPRSPRRWPTRISASAACSRPGSRNRAAAPCRPPWCRSRRIFAMRSRRHARLPALAAIPIRRAEPHRSGVGQGKLGHHKARLHEDDSGRG